MDLLEQLGLSVPLVQAPMAGVATPELAAAVSNAGALGSLGVGATNAEGAQKMITALQAATTASFNVNVFVHKDPTPDAQIAARWCAALAPEFARFNAAPPQALQVIYKSFANDDAMLRTLVQLAPPVVSFHFGLPDPQRIAALKQAGCLLFASATSLPEAQAAQNAGLDAIVAQGHEAGGHRGIFDPEGTDERLSTEQLTRLLTANISRPVIAAGGIMDGKDIRAALGWGAAAAQMGTAFIACPESAADAAYRTALLAASGNADQGGTVMTPAISGRPARCLANRFTAWAADQTIAVPAYPTAYDAGKALNAVAKACGEHGYGAQWAGTGAARTRPMAAADLVQTLARELAAAGT